MAVTTGNNACGPAKRWRPKTYAEEVAAEQQSPAPEKEQVPTPPDGDIVIRISRSTLLALLNSQQEQQAMSNNANSTAKTTAANQSATVAPINDSVSLDLARARLAELNAETATVEALIASQESSSVAPVVAAAAAKGRANTAKTIGKYALGTGVVGVVALGGVYAFKLWQASQES